MGDPMEKNIQTCLEPEYWEAFIDMMAKNRFNLLSLWAEHPFHMMFRLAKYPDTCPYTDEQLHKYMSLYRFIMSHAHKRGVKVFLITWNIRITEFVARGLRIPDAVGQQKDRYMAIYQGRNGLYNTSEHFNIVRQKQPIVKDYFKECIKTLLMTYPELDGIGTNCAEEMSGTAFERQQWVAECYIEGIRESGRDIPFVMRTNMGNGKTAKAFIDECPSDTNYISWKYSNAHMYSHPEPQFEKLWDAWDGMDMDDTNVLYTVRNDDHHTFRWGDSKYIRQYIKGMTKKPYVKGYYYGADGYIWADDFQHTPFGHKTWKYDFERHWHEFELLGRLGYNPEIPDTLWKSKYETRYGSNGELLFEAMTFASKILPPISRLHWINYDFEWHPESLLTVTGLKTVAEFAENPSMPEVGTVSISDFAKAEAAGKDIDGETPLDVIKIIREASNALEEKLLTIKKSKDEHLLVGEAKCLIADLEAWMYLGKYYAIKFSASLELRRLKESGSESHRQNAVNYLQDAVGEWEKLTIVWAGHYIPYKMVRSKYIFGYGLYLEDVKKDIEIAKRY
jgi:hypothetical protein